MPWNFPLFFFQGKLRILVAFPPGRSWSCTVFLRLACLPRLPGSFAFPTFGWPKSAEPFLKNNPGHHNMQGASRHATWFVSFDPYVTFFAPNPDVIVQFLGLFFF